MDCLSLNSLKLKNEFMRLNDRFRKNRNKRILMEEKLMYCLKCGNKLDEDAKFCSKCGKPVTEDQPSGLIKKCLSSKKIIIIALLIALVLVIFGGVKLLTKSTEKSIVGTWICTVDEEWSLTFKDNGTFYDSDSYFLYYTKVGKWEIPSDGILYLKGDVDEGTLDFELEGNILTIYVTDSVYPFYNFQKRE